MNIINPFNQQDRKKSNEIGLYKTTLKEGIQLKNFETLMRWIKTKLNGGLSSTTISREGTSRRYLQF